VHPTRAGLDRTARLERTGAGIYEGSIERPIAGRWRVLLEDGARSWRMSAEMSVPGGGMVVIDRR
jgi:hypothetical protein